ncbi:Rho guanyl-nucleotide exchange factor [Galdieria sulphuraria]|uniref:Rho guanyl-nucleotide exchange factor n=1 Tax=Galdieria sulphuraria TaxID=130081 RepID=M2WYP3_GALSU|nr:Rho guanyl-nucleotide exchange factor [Galdieria sulphuraria]EME29175.1 Rho guanyl-nucleotide exchange factor [Galdieria sulphuraria]|eukprot:XP_005705695.1 Rho guanyl-nucleotide exchange factor [Galdieria sulphuraria]
MEPVKTREDRGAESIIHVKTECKENCTMNSIPKSEKRELHKAARAAPRKPFIQPFRNEPLRNMGVLSSLQPTGAPGSYAPIDRLNQKKRSPSYEKGVKTELKGQGEHSGSPDNQKNSPEVFATKVVQESSSSSSCTKVAKDSSPYGNRTKSYNIQDLSKKKEKETRYETNNQSNSPNGTYSLNQSPEKATTISDSRVTSNNSSSCSNRTSPQTSSGECREQNATQRNNDVPYVTQIFQKALIVAHEAATNDESGDYEQAYNLYIQVIELFMQAIPFLDSSEANLCMKQVNDFLSRCEALRESLYEASICGDFTSLSILNEHDSSAILWWNGPDGVAGQRDHLNPQWHYSNYTKQGSHSNSPASGEAGNNSFNKTRLLTPNELDQMKQEIEMWKARYAEMTLAVDSSGNPEKSRALILSKRIENLHAGTFGEFKKLEPLDPKALDMWNRELHVLYDTLENIVVQQPAQKVLEDGTTIQIMVKAKRPDIANYLPRLQELDKLLQDFFSSLECLRGIITYESCSKPSQKTEQWWVCEPLLPSSGLSPEIVWFLTDLEGKSRNIWLECRQINEAIIAKMNMPTLLFLACQRKPRKY